MNQPPPYTPRLSKSRYISGKQCHLRLWNECFAPELATPYDEGHRAIFAVGHEVGELATRRYPGGEMIDEDHRDFAGARAHTLAAMAGDCSAIFEAAFEHQGVMCRVDVLVRAADGAWDVVEVKSTGSAKDVHVADLAVQTWIVRGAGVRVRKSGVLTLNTGYEYQGGALNLQALFKLNDKTNEVAGLAYETSRRVVALQAMLSSSSAPKVAPGAHCHQPYDCQFYAHCTRDLPQPLHPLSELPSFPKLKVAQWQAKGVVDILELPEEAGLNPLQARVRQSLRSGDAYRGAGLAAALREPLFPIHHLDFESFMPVIPRYKGTRPFQALPVQWSNHIQHEDGRLEHHEFLWTQDDDPRPQCARTLLAALGESGTIVTYSPYEQRMIKDLMKAVPECSEQLSRLLERIWDLHPVFKEHFYHPAFRGSFSIKSVLPALVPGMTYEGMEIGDGGTAAIEYNKMISSDDPKEKERIRKALLKYCAQDTLALVKLRAALEKEAEQ